MQRLVKCIINKINTNEEKDPFSILKATESNILTSAITIVHITHGSDGRGSFMFYIWNIFVAKEAPWSLWGPLFIAVTRDGKNIYDGAEWVNHSCQ